MGGCCGKPEKAKKKYQVPDHNPNIGGPGFSMTPSQIFDPPQIFINFDKINKNPLFSKNTFSLRSLTPPNFDKFSPDFDKYSFFLGPPMNPNINDDFLK